MKKATVCLLAAILILSIFAGCGRNREEPVSTPAASPSPDVTKDPVPGEEASPEVTDDMLPDVEDGTVEDSPAHEGEGILQDAEDAVDKAGEAVDDVLTGDEKDKGSGSTGSGSRAITR